MDQIREKVEALLHREKSGVTRLARLINAPVTTVHKWKKAGVPDWRWDQIEAAFRTEEKFKTIGGQ